MPRGRSDFKRMPGQALRYHQAAEAVAEPTFPFQRGMNPGQADARHEAFHPPAMIVFGGYARAPSAPTPGRCRREGSEPVILTRDEILSEIDAGRIGIDPFVRDAVGPASIDLRLGPEIRIFSPMPTVLPITTGTDYRDITYRLELADQGYIIKPNELVLGMTLERVTLPPDIAGWLGSRSRFARLGLMVHISAPFMQPGISNHQVLEILNTGPNFLKLIPGERICQFVFERCEGQAVYRGQYSDQHQGRW